MAATVPAMTRMQNSSAQPEDNIRRVKVRSTSMSASTLNSAATFSELSTSIGKLSKATKNARRLPQQTNVADGYQCYRSQHTIALPTDEEQTTKDLLIQSIGYLLSTKTLIYPTHPSKIAWDKLIILLLAYTAIEIPLKTSFGIKFSVEFDLVVTIVFILDIWISFRTTFIDKHTQEYETILAVVARKYLKTWFGLDFVASVPLDEFASIFNADKDLRKIFSLFHLLRVLKLGRIMSNFSSMSRCRAFTILSVIFLFFSHFGACIFHYFGTLHPYQGWLIEDDLVHKNNFNRYVSAYYWALSTITTIGYGDIHAITFDERIFSCVMVIVSAIVYSLLLAAMSLILGEIFHSDHEASVHKSQCKSYSTQLKFDENLIGRIELINDYFNENKYNSSIGYILTHGHFPNSIKHQIIEKALKPIIESNISFGAFKDNTLLEFAHRLQYCVSSPNEYLFAYNDITSNVYIAQSGVVRIFNPEKSDLELCRLGTGAHFGEIPLFALDDLIEKQTHEIVNSSTNRDHSTAASKRGDNVNNNDIDNIDPQYDTNDITTAAVNNEKDYDSEVISTAEQCKDDFDKHCQLYQARKSPICAVCHTYCIFYFLSYRDFKSVILIDPKLYKLFKTIALARIKQDAPYSDSELCNKCVESVNDECQEMQRGPLRRPRESS